MRVALLEDDRPQAELIKTWLEAAQHHCRHYERGNRLMGDLEQEKFDLILLDWMLPDVEGIEVLARIRHRVGWEVPVLFITGRDGEADIACALEQGADDYLVKPLRRGELLARMAAVTRRGAHQEEEPQRLEFDHYVLDATTRTVYRDGDPVVLTEKEFSLAMFLFRSEGQILSRGHLLENVWGRSPVVTTRTVDTHISRLRHKLDLTPEIGWRLQAVYQRGYRLEHLDDAEVGKKRTN